MNIEFSQREIDWLNNYAGNKDLSIPAAVRQAVRVLSLIEGTPGAWDAVDKLTNEMLGPKYEPMPPLPAVETSARPPLSREYEGRSHRGITRDWNYVCTDNDCWFWGSEHHNPRR